FGDHLVDGDLVVAIDARRRAQFPKEMNKVVGKAVVIVDQRQHCRTCYARAKRAVKFPASLDVAWREEQLELAAVDGDVLPSSGRETQHDQPCRWQLGFETVLQLRCARADQIEGERMKL